MKSYKSSQKSNNQLQDDKDSDQGKISVDSDQNELDIGTDPMGAFDDDIRQQAQVEHQLVGGFPDAMGSKKS